MKVQGIAITCILFLAITPQTGNKLSESLDYFNNAYPQEKVYLHLDKPYYYSNEDIWFKAYLVAGPMHKPSVFSDNIQVELIDGQGTLLSRNRIVLENGFGHGDFDLPDLPSGNYTIRAYSHWMRNFDPDFFFQKQIAIISPIDGKPLVKASDSLLSLSFHPEGGDLINTVVSRVTLKASAPGRIGNDQKVQVYDDKDRLIASMKTNKDGIGSFRLTPQATSHYYATIEGQEGRFDLPKAKETGYTLAFQPARNGQKPKMIINTPELGGKEHKLFLVAHTRGIIGYASQVEFKGSSVQLEMPDKDLATGVVHLTLFNEQWRPEAERLFFHMGNDLLNIELSTDKSIYESRDSTIVDILVRDSNGQPVEGSFSLSALDAGQIDAALTEEHILSELLLSSDLKGHISNPARFFGESVTENQEALDLIMMTHGWRRFTWKELLNGNFPDIKYGFQKGITVQGRLLSKEGGEPVKGGTISHMGSFNNNPSLASTESLKEGFFALGNLYFYEEEENFLEGELKKKRGKTKKLFVEVDTTSVDYPPFAITEIPLTGLDTAVIEDHITKSIERQQLKAFQEFDDEAQDLGEVIVEGIRSDDTEKYNQEFYALDFDKYALLAKNGATALDIIRGRLPSVIVRGRGSNARAVLTYNTTIRNLNTNPLVLLDGHPITWQQLWGLPAGRIKRAEVYRGTKELAATTDKTPEEIMRGGVLEFITRTDEEMKEYYRLIGSNNVKTLPGGFYKSRTFFAPRYGTDMPKNPLPDRRMLIHWEPMIQTDARGRARLSFYNADPETIILIDVQGLSLKGEPGIAKTSYQVKN